MNITEKMIESLEQTIKELQQVIEIQQSYVEADFYYLRRVELSIMLEEFKATKR